jgi:hypothetical protein
MMMKAAILQVHSLGWNELRGTHCVVAAPPSVQMVVFLLVSYSPSTADNAGHCAVDRWQQVQWFFLFLVSLAHNSTVLQQVFAMSVLGQYTRHALHFVFLLLFCFALFCVLRGAPHRSLRRVSACA